MYWLFITCLKVFRKLSVTTGTGWGWCEDARHYQKETLHKCSCETWITFVGEAVKSPLLSKTFLKMEEPQSILGCFVGDAVFTYQWGYRSILLKLLGKKNEIFSKKNVIFGLQIYICFEAKEIQPLLCVRAASLTGNTLDRGNCNHI